ncbi:MAG: rhodanese-like domain-containing protein [Candidatus Flexifilum sp.]
MDTTMNLFKSVFGTASAVRAVNASEAKQLIDSDKNVFILDVRQPNEFEGGHIQGAKLIPLNELPNSLDKLPKDKTILCVCRSGARSGAAARQLANAGFNAINLSGGMIGWQMAKLPIKRGK